MSDEMLFLMIVDDPAIASFVAANGVDRLFVDLETIGKQARQGHVPSWKSRQTPADVSIVREAAPDAKLLVRVNPLYAGSAAEIDDVIARGADSVMLPMFRSEDELRAFFDLLRGRVEGVPLFETASSLKISEAALRDLPVRYAHIGLNDLHLDLGSDFIFEPLADGVLDGICRTFRCAGIRFGIGGIARAGEGAVSPECLLGEHARLGSTGAILSRTFHRNAASLEELIGTTDFASEVAELRRIYRRFRGASATQLEENRRLTVSRIRVAARLARMPEEQV